MKPHPLLALAGSLLLASLVATPAAPLGTAFTYQGRLADGGQAANGHYDLQFTLYDAVTAGNVQGVPLTTNAVAVSNGLFTLTLDFGNVFDGNARWLQIEVRTNGSGAFTPLVPRQSLMPAPYSLYAPSAGNAALLNGQSPTAYAPAAGSPTYVAKTGDTMTGTLNLPANGLVAGGSQLVLSGGRVGIGTPTPAAKLDVAGTAAITVPGSSSSIEALNVEVASFVTDTNAVASHFLRIRDGAGNIKLIVKGTGDVGIGTPTPAAKLDVAGTTAIQVPASGNLIEALNVDVASFVTGPNAEASHYFRIRDVGAGDVKFIVKGTGDVGIGTASPVKALEVRREVLIKGNNDGGTEYNDWPFASLSIRRSDDFSVNGVTMLSLGYRNDPLYTTDDSVANIRLWDPSQSPNAATSTGTTQLRIASPGPLVLQPNSGNVGIGTGTPAAALHVAGAVAIGNTTDPAPPAGTMRWTGSDFEGYNGTNWVSLTGRVIVPTNDMALIPAGSFTMGDTLDGLGDAVPVSVTLSAFFIDVNEVSWSQWQSVYAYATSHGYGFVHAGAGKAANHPVQTVDWYDVVKWCNARSEQGGLTPVYYTDAGLTAVYRTEERAVYADWAVKGYRLPTEAEWEKAAQGGLSGQRFPWGNVINENLANYYGNTAGYSYDLGPNGYNPIGRIGGTSPATSPVGSFAANGYGLNDMAGNVFEWCWDWYGTPYAGGSDPHGPVGPLSYRVLRGGTWNSHADDARCADRGLSTRSNANDFIGFRCVRGL